MTRLRKLSWRATAATLTAVAMVAAGACLRGSGALALMPGQRHHAVAVVAATADPGPSGAVTNPDWAALQTLFTTSPSDSSVDMEGHYQAGGTGDDGIVLLRVFIPAQNAAGGLLLGDNRGFTDDPSAPFRAEVAWDTRIGIDPNAPNGELHIRLSLLNPLTNSDYPPGFGLGAWSVDQEATVTRTASGTYQLALNGNGYPAVEAYYYPHYTGTSVTGGLSSVIAKRSVEPAFVGNPIDVGGGMAALDSNSSVQCKDSGPGAFRCQNTLTATEPAWTTTDQQTSAM
jgi:hypothetical protein